MIQIDIQMPESCRDCPFEMYYMNCGETRCRASNMVLADGYKAISFEGRHPDCPLMEVVQCKDCDWWTKQEASLQGRCQVHGMYPTGAYYCGTGKRREE